MKDKIDVKEARQVSWLDLGAISPNKDVSRILEETAASIGAVRNSQFVIAHEPSRFLALHQYGEALMADAGSELSERDREFVALVVSVFNRCVTCVCTHSSELRRITNDPNWVERLCVNPRHAISNERDYALVCFASKLTETPAEICPVDIEPLRSLGISELAILELVHLISYYNASNRLMSGLGIQPTAQTQMSNR